MSSQQQNLNALLETQKLREQGRQFGSELGLKGAQTAIGAGEGLAKIGATQQSADLERLKFQEAMGQLSQSRPTASIRSSISRFYGPTTGTLYATSGLCPMFCVARAVWQRM
jgi:hypothetical protein